MTARERFVEAMRSMTYAHNQSSHQEAACVMCVKRIETACDAFADAECSATEDGRGTVEPCHDRMVYHIDQPNEIERAKKRHAEHRASLRRECGLEKRCAPLPEEETR